jgi:hypothetical protein
LYKYTRWDLIITFLAVFGPIGAVGLSCVGCISLLQEKFEIPVLVNNAGQRIWIDKGPVEIAQGKSTSFTWRESLEIQTENGEKWIYRTGAVGTANTFGNHIFFQLQPDGQIYLEAVPKAGFLVKARHGKETIYH